MQDEMDININALINQLIVYVLTSTQQDLIIATKPVGPSLAWALNWYCLPGHGTLVVGLDLG